MQSIHPQLPSFPPPSNYPNHAPPTNLKSIHREWSKASISSGSTYNSTATTNSPRSVTSMSRMSDDRESLGLERERMLRGSVDTMDTVPDSEEVAFGPSEKIVTAGETVHEGDVLEKPVTNTVVSPTSPASTEITPSSRPSTSFTEEQTSKSGTSPNALTEIISNTDHGLRKASISSVYGRKPAPRLTESLENLSIVESSSIRRASVASLASSSDTFGMGSAGGRVGSGGSGRLGGVGGTAGSARARRASHSSGSEDGRLTSGSIQAASLQGRNLSMGGEEKGQTALARRLSSFSFGRRVDVPPVPSPVYRKASLSLPISAPMATNQPLPSASTIILTRPISQLPAIPQSPHLGSDRSPRTSISALSSPLPDASRTAKQRATGRKRSTANSTPTMPSHIVIPSRMQSLPSTTPAMLANNTAKSSDVQMSHPHFQYNSTGDNRISIISDVSGEGIDGTPNDEQAAQYAAFNIRLADVVDSTPTPRKFSDQTFKSDFSLSRGNGAVEDDDHPGTAGEGGSDTEIEIDRYREMPTPTLIVDSGSSGEYRAAKFTGGEDMTPTTSVRGDFSGPIRPNWLEAAGHYSSGQTVAMRSASEDETPNASDSRLGLGITSTTHLSASPTGRRRRQSWQALKELEFQERHRDEKGLVETKKRGRKLRLRPRNHRTTSDEMPETSGSVGLREAMRNRREKKKADKQRFIDECDVPPSTSDLFDVSLMEVLDVEGKAVPFGEIVRGGAGRKTVVVFIRHWYCPLCGEYVENIIRNVSPTALEAANVDLVIIGHGSAKMLPGYSKVFKCPFRMYTDPKLQVYKGLGMTLKTADAGADVDKGDYLEKNALAGNWEVAKRATKMPMRNPGHFFQLGGEFIFKNSLHCEWAHRMTNTRNHASITTILEVAGVSNPEVPSSPDNDVVRSESRFAPPIHGEDIDQSEMDMTFGNWADSGVNVSPAERYALEERKRSVGQEWLVEREEELERIKVERERRRVRMENMGLSGCDSVEDLGEEDE